MEHIQTRILKQEILYFYIDGVYKLYFDTSNKTFALYFRDEMPFLFDFLTMPKALNFLHGNYVQEIYSGGDTLIYCKSDNENVIKMLKVECYTNDLLNHGLESITFQIQYFLIGSNSSKGQVRDGHRFCLQGRDATLNFLKLQPKIEILNREYGIFDQRNKIVMSTVAEIYVKTRINDGYQLPEVQIFRTPDKTEDRMIWDFLKFFPNFQIKHLEEGCRENSSVPDYTKYEDYFNLILKKPSLRKILFAVIRERLDSFKKCRAQDLRSQISAMT
nr:MAG: hypothetical protein [Porcellio scaber clopovirus]